MQLRLRTKLTLIMTSLVLLVVAVLSVVFVAQLLGQVLEQTDKRTHEIAHQGFVQAARALKDAAGSMSMFFHSAARAASHLARCAWWWIPAFFWRRRFPQASENSRPSFCSPW